MSDDDGDGGGSGRNVEQALLALAVVAGLLVAAALLPALPVAGSGSGGDAGDGDAGDGRSVGGPGESRLGALNPGRRTNVGGSLAGDGDGGLRNTSDAVHFVVESPRPAYWRTGAYGRYTGSGWASRGGRDPVAGASPGSGERLRQEVTLRRSSTALPAAWKPATVSVFGGNPRVLVTERGSFVAPDGLSAGTGYAVTSYVTRPSPDELRTTGSRYPPDVERYTRLPSETTDRLRRFTDRLASDADGTYETARVIELWLERSKDYSLDASHDPTRPVADEFVFEMERGYCEYFATAMTVMLRSQGIPARYVVGYAPGTRVANDTYAVRALDAHAWVEVYFPDVGWVRFDPTPAADRRASERESIGRQGGPDRRPRIEGSPGDDGGDGIGPDDAPGLPGPGDRSPRVGPPYDLAVTPDPVPGRVVTVTVTKDGLPVEDVVVTFDGDPVGRTDRNGNVTARVPYADDLEIDAVVPAAEDGSGESGSGDDDPDGGGDGDGPDGGDADGDDGSRADLGTWGADPLAAFGSAPLATLAAAPAHVQSGRSPVLAGAEADSANDSATAPRRFDLSTDVTWAVEGALAPGREAVLVATIDGVPVRDAPVTVDGRTVGRTDARGRVTASVPEEARGSVRAGIERGAVEDRDRIDLADLSVSVHPDSLVALPGVGATVRVTVGDEPVENATVAMDGRRVGRTGTDGRVRASLPVANAARFGADGPVLTAGTTVSGMYRNAALLGLALVGLVGAAVVGARRRGVTAGSVASGGRSLLHRATALATRLAHRTAATARRLLRGVGSLLGRGSGWLGDHLSNALRRVRSVGIRRVVAGAIGAVGGLALGALWWLAGLPAALLGLPARIRARFGRDAGGSGRLRGDPCESPGDDETPPAVAVREAFRELVRMLGIRGWRTMTPGEIARAATDRGLPEGPVRAVTDAFRDVEYGGVEPSEALRDRVAGALSLLRDGDGGGE